MVNAAATAALVAMAPGRVAIGFGTGFTGRRAMGYGAITWGYMRRYIEAYTALLRGDSPGPRGPGGGADRLAVHPPRRGAAWSRQPRLLPPALCAPPLPCHT